MTRISNLRPLLPLLLAWLMAGCTLYMDGDGQQDDTTADGDGFTAPKTIKDSITSITYQFNAGTLMLDDRYRPYIAGYDTDSLHDRTEIRLRRSIPAALVPQRGNRLSTDLHDIFTDGLLHEVDAVVSEGGLMVVKAHRTTVDEVFQTLHISSDFYMALDSTSTPQRAGGTRATEDGGYAYRLKPVGRKPTGHDARASAIEEDMDYNFLHLELLHLPHPSYSLTDKLTGLSPKTQKILQGLGNVKEHIDKALVKPFGSFDGGVAATFDMGLKLHFEYDKETKLMDLHGWGYQKSNIGLYVKEAKGGVSIPLAGWGRREVKRANSTVGTSSTEVDRYLCNIRTRDVPIPAGPVKLSVNVQPNLVLDLFAAYQFSEGGDALRYGRQCDYDIVEFGFHDDPVNGLYSYPRQKGTARSTSETDDEWDTSFAAGMELHASLDFIIKFYEVLQCRVSPQASLTIGYERNLTDKYRLDDFTTESGTPHSPSYGGSSDTYVQLSLGTALSGVMEFGPLWTVDLFSIDALSPSLTWKWPLYPDFLTTVQPDEEASTQEQSAYVAEVKASQKFLYTPRESPMLAIYRAPTDGTDGRKTFVKLVRADHPASAFDEKTTLSYRFTIPGRDTRHIYYAVPVYLTGYGITREYLHGTPTPFFSTYSRLTISGMEQMRVRDAHKSDGTKVYAFKFRLSGVTPAEAKKHMVIIGIYDREGGTLLATKKFALGQLPRGRFSRDYAFFFTGRNESYHAMASYYVDDGHGDFNDISLQELDLTDYGGKEEIDDLRYDFSGDSPYHLLQ